MTLECNIIAGGTMYFSSSSGFHHPEQQKQEQVTQLHHRQQRPKCQNASNIRSTCPKCFRSYRHAYHMIRHQKFECNTPPRFQCPYCGMKSKQSNNVYKHIRSKHPGLPLEIVRLQYEQQ